MGLFSRIFSKAPRSRGAKGPDPQPTFGSDGSLIFGVSSESLSTPQGQAREGYRNNPYIYRSCNYYGIFASLPQTIIRGTDGDDLDGHPLDLLMQRPNPRMSGKEFMHTIGVHMGIYGEAFVYPVWTVRGLTRLELFDPMDVQTSETGDRLEPVSEYHINRGTGGMLTVAPEDMIHIRFYNPEGSGARGLSPMVAAKRSVEMQNAIRDWNISATRNGAKTSLIINVDRELTPEQRQKLTAEMDARYAGKNNVGKGMILDRGKTASTLGMTAVEMDFIQSIAVGARECAVAYGVASEMLGDAQNKTYSNMMEANRQTVQTTAIPLLQLIYDALTVGILRDPRHKAYPEVERITYDPEQVNDITVDKTALYSAMESATYLTVNEKRAKLGYDPINDPAADIPLVNMGLGPLSSAGETEPDIDETEWMPTGGEDDG